MTTQLALPFDLPPDDAEPDTLEQFASAQLASMRTEAETAAELSQTAFSRAWAVGKTCVKLKEHVGEDAWEQWAAEHIGAGQYDPVYRCMRLARMSPDRPPLRGSGQYKQLQIALGNEPPPKQTPRKTDAFKFSNLKAAIGAVRRWWREGDAVTGMDNETLREIRDDLLPVMEIFKNIQTRLEAEG